MEKHTEDETGVDWRPDWQGADLARVRALEAEAAAKVGLFRRMRRELGLTQAETASLLATTQANISKMERREVLDLAALRVLAASRQGRLKLTLELEGGRSVDLSPELA